MGAFGKGGVRGGNARGDWLLLLIFLALAAGIVLKSYFNSRGYLSPDSVEYLRASKYLLRGEGLTRRVDPFTGEREFFAMWPPGYPLLISFVAGISGLGVFWSSKVVNMLCIGLTLLLLRMVFRKEAWIYGLLLCSADFIEIYSYSWSESPFVFGMLWFAAALFFFAGNDDRGLLLLNVFASMVFLFFCRYIGAFSVLAALVFCLFLSMEGNYRGALRLGGVVLAAAAAMGWYLRLNYLRTGFATGIRRIAAPETHLQLLRDLLVSQVHGLNLLISSIFMGRIYVWAWKVMLAAVCLLLPLTFFFFFCSREREGREIAPAADDFRLLRRILLIAGSVYLVSIVLIRWNRFFDRFDVRFFLPGYFLLALALVNYLRHRAGGRFWTATRKSLALVALISLVLNVAVESWWSWRISPLSYPAYVAGTRERYSFLRPGDMLLFGDVQLDYLRLDVFTRPFFLPQEDIGTFAERCEKFRGRVFVQLRSRKDLEKRKDYAYFVKRFGLRDGAGAEGDVVRIK